MMVKGIYKKRRGKVTIRKRTILFAFTISLYILSEYFGPLHWLDSTNLKHAFLMIAILIYFVPAIIGREKSLVMKDECKTICITVAILYVISLVFQVKNGSFKIYSVAEVYFFLAPLFFAAAFINKADREDVDNFMIWTLYIALFSFLLPKFMNGSMVLQNIIGLFDIRALVLTSTSSIGESDLSNYFMLLFIYFIYRNNKKHYILAAVGCFLGYKRVTVLFLIVMVIVLRFIPREKLVPKGVWIATVVAFVALPALSSFLYTDEFASFFYQTFGIDFNMFSMSRYSITRAVIRGNVTNYGLGTITNWLENRGVALELNLHNDLLRIYMETTIIGSVALTYGYFKISRKNLFSYCMMLFIFIECYVAHWLAAGTVGFWIVAYTALFTFNRDMQVGEDG